VDDSQRDFITDELPATVIRSLIGLNLKAQEALDLTAFLMGLEIQTEYGRPIHWNLKQLNFLKFMRDGYSRGRNNEDGDVQRPNPFVRVSNRDGAPI
jgi:hypothetical protein